MKPARTCRPKSKLRVAVMISQDEAVAHHVDVYYGIQEHALRTGEWELVLDPFADQQLKADKRAYDGVIARATPLLCRLSQEHGIPVVNVWQNSPVADRLPAVYADGLPAGRMAADHLLARGFQRFGLLVYHNDRFGEHYSRGFGDRLKEAGMRLTTLKVSTNMGVRRVQWERDSGRLRQWVESWELPIGVAGSYDQLMQTLANLCRTEYGIAIPHELALVGNGNERTRCNQPALKLTSIEMNRRLQGRVTAELLEAMMAGEPAPEEPLWVEPAELVARQSTDVIAVDDPVVAGALKYIAEHCHRPIQVIDVAHAMAMSLRSLQERFRQRIDRSISQQIESMRIERLKRLMLHSEEPIKVLARQCGFISMNTLHRAFLRAEGVPPSQFRRERE